MAERQCPFCGKLLRPEALTCPFCRSDLPALTQAPVGLRSMAGATRIRRGVLYMLLATIIYYFVGSYSGLPLPATAAPFLTDWALPLLFLGGLGLAAYGVYCQFTR